MTVEPFQSKPRNTTMPPTQQRDQTQDLTHHQRDTFDTLIKEQILHTLGKPGDLLAVQVRLLWARYYRVNIFVGKGMDSARIAKSYFLTTDSDGKIIESTPKIAKAY